MTDYHVTVTAEPPALHDTPGFAVHVVPNTLEATTGQEAKTIIQDFFESPAPSLWALTLRNFDPIGIMELKRVQLTSVDTSSAIFSWLKDRAPQIPQIDGDGGSEVAVTEEDISAYWIGNGADSDAIKNGTYEETVLKDKMHIPAMDLLRASLNWAAPVPQGAGLTHLGLARDDLQEDVQLIIFPWWSMDMPPYDVEVKRPDGKPLNHSKKGDAIELRVGDVVYLTTFVDPFQPIVANGDQDGWVKPGWANSKDIKSLRRIRTEMTGSFDPFAPLMGLNFEELVADPGNLTAIADWLQTAGTTLLFDRIDLAALRTDGSAENRPEGRLRDSLEDIMEALAEEVLPEGQRQLAEPKNWIDTGLADLYQILMAAAFPDLAEKFKPASQQTQSAVTDADEVDVTNSNSGMKALEAAIARVNELALAFTDPEQMRRLVKVYLRLATDNWRKIATDPVSQKDLVDQAEAAFEAYYTGPGADLIAELRADNADALMQSFRGNLNAKVEELADLKEATTADGKTRIQLALEEFNWIIERLSSAPLGLRSIESLEKFWDVAGKPLKESYANAIVAALSTDFVADLEPQPLTIVATDQIESEALDEIARQTTGFGLVIGAAHTHSEIADAPIYAHANAAELTLKRRTSTTTETIEIGTAIETSTLVENYGQLEIAIDYTGLPIVGREVAQSRLAEHALETDLPRPYVAGLVNYNAAPTQPPLPPLAYGYDYSALPFYVPNSGTLPRELRSDGEPLLPTIGEKLPPDYAVDKYRRTTAIAAVSVTNTPTSEHPGIGYIPGNVMPIAPDLVQPETEPGLSLTEERLKRDDGHGLLLLGAKPRKGKSDPVWNADLSNGATLNISAPRVSFEDFVRWVENPHLLNDMNSDAEAELKTGLTEEIVETINQARDHFEDKNFAPGSELLNRLPDPAVRKLMVRLEIVDRLWEMTVKDIKKFKDLEFHIAPYHKLPSNEFKTVNDVMKYIEEIDKNAQFETEIRVQNTEREFDFTEEGKLIVSVQPGDICRLSVSPLVKQENYDENSKLRAIHPGFRDIKNNEFKPYDGTFFCLGSSTLMVEAMDIPPKSELGSSPTDDIFNALQIQPEGRDRGFTLQLCPAFEGLEKDQRQAVYRAFSEVDLITHRWRPTGRPIRDWINPIEKRKKRTSGDDASVNTPVEVIAFDNEVAKFEESAFLDRPLFDGERRRIKLPTFLPNNGKNNALILDRVNWPSQSATYVRYAQIFRSRYAGALAAGTGEIPAIANALETVSRNPRKPNQRFTARAAILADISSSTIVSPQLRHILPSLTRSQDEDAPLPLVLSLNERPFDQYGLADRILPEVTTIQTYDLANKTEIDFKDFRKEVGPDPRVGLNPISDDKSRRVTMRAEGPVGHHFDPPAADAPGFVNSSYLLHFEGLDSAWAHDQMFSAIELRRLVDPGWTHVPPVNERATHPSMWTIDLDNLASGLEIVHGSEDAAKVHISTGENGVLVKIDPKAAYGAGDTQTPDTSEFRELCLLDGENNHLRLIHRSLGRDGFEIAILRQAAAGTLSDPQIVASARYKARGKPAVINENGGALSLTPVLMSGAPTAQWTQSGYDMGHVCLGDRIAPIVEAKAVITAGELRFGDQSENAVRLSSRDALIEHPIGVHTYLAALTLRKSANDGRTVLLPEETVLLDPVGHAELETSQSVEKAALMAFAAPAELVISNAVAVCEEVRKITTFDLDAVQKQGPSGRLQSDLMFRCRLVEGEGSGTCTLKFSAADDIDPLAIALSDDHLKGLQFLEICIGDDGKLRAVRRYTDEESGVSATIEDAIISGSVDLSKGAISLQIDDNASIVMDVSLLPAVSQNRSGWNWDWVFPPVSTGSIAQDVESDAGPAAMDDALRPTALHQQREAVLAPLGISDAFTISST